MIFKKTGCIEKIYSVSALVGTGVCNGACDFCAGAYLRPQARINSYYSRDNNIYWKNYEAAIKLSARYGGWSLSLTSSGEPTCDPEDVTTALNIYHECANQGAFFPNVNLFSNGILLADDDFCAKWLPLWRKLGLTNIAISIHSPVESEQAKAYGLETYPEFKKIFCNIRKYGIGVRATLLLNRRFIGTAQLFVSSLVCLTAMGADNITSWPIANPNGTRNEYTPSWWELCKIRWWLKRNAKLCHGHVWGGAVYDWHGNMVRITDYVTKHDPSKDYVRQLVVFQDGTVAYSWIREGALCMK